MGCCSVNACTDGVRRTADESSSAGRTAAPQFALNCAQLALIQIDGVLLCVRACVLFCGPHAQHRASSEKRPTHRL